MLNPQQIEIFFTNIADFTLTRNFLFYSPKEYEGLTDYADNLGGTVISKHLIPQGSWEKWQTNFPKQAEKVQEQASNFSETLREEAQARSYEDYLATQRKLAEELKLNLESFLAATPNLTSLSPEELLKTRETWIKWHQQLNQYFYYLNLELLGPYRERMDKFYLQLDPLIKQHYSNRWQELAALQRLGLNKGQQLNERALQIIDKYGTLRDETVNTSAQAATNPEKESETTQLNSPTNPPESMKNKSSPIYPLFLLLVVIISCLLLVTKKIKAKSNLNK